MKHLADPRALVPGTQLVARRRGYVHFGIYVGCGRVVHYAGRLQYPQGLVEEISLPDFAAGRPVYVDSTPDRFTGKEDIVRRALPARRTLLRRVAEQLRALQQLVPDG